MQFDDIIPAAVYFKRRKKGGLKMEWKSTNDLRECFLIFFESKNHIRTKSFSLVPENDNSLLLINSGMAPLKAYFLGQKKIKTNRITSSQKCIRTPDIERVGITSRHGTFFEMLGNFSFGDYFKAEAIRWAFEFTTQIIAMPLNKFHVSVYEKDNETYNIWVNEIGIPENHMIRLGKDDNFWEIGSGPCGPCTELYFDRGEKNGCGLENCAPGCDCDRFIELWNIVFSEFNSDGNGNYTELEKKNIDTGMGLERLACIVQGVNNLFEVDSVKEILEAVCKISGKDYNTNKNHDTSIRVITDHIRSSVFMISDKILPANEGRGYVLRRLLRRAMRHGQKLGLTEPFLFELCEKVISCSKVAYPELEQNRAYIKKVINGEEVRFKEILDHAMLNLNDIIADLKAKGTQILSGEIAFELHDTSGFPLDLIIDVTNESGIEVDMQKFNRLMEKQKQMARNARKKINNLGWKEDNSHLFNNIKIAEFIGYEKLFTETKVLALLKEGVRVESVGTGTNCKLVIEKTPFYSESGGQISDTGQIKFANGLLNIVNSQKLASGQIILSAQVISGELRVGETVHCLVDRERRHLICKNHSACHILQKALQEILGAHIMQAGSYVDEKRLRFDFFHFEAVTPEQLAAVQKKVNDIIFAESPVKIEEMPLETAKKIGAMALFEEKYLATVRVCYIGDYSIELCGGTHVANTAQINMFKILSESSVASGVRRIEATTSANVFFAMERTDKILARIAKEIKANDPSEIEKRVSTLLKEVKDATTEIKKLRHQTIQTLIETQAATAKDFRGIKLLSLAHENFKAENLKDICDKLKSKLPDSVIVAVAVGTKNSILVNVSGSALNKYNAATILKEILETLGGNGGGNSKFARGSILKITNLENVVMAALGE